MAGRDTILFGTPAASESAPRASILHCIKMLAPFQEAIPEEDGYDAGNTAEGERQFYAFIRQLYDSMYSDPAFFLIPEGEYDAYRRSCGKKGGERLHKVDQKECRLRNRFQQAIRFCPAYLYELGLRARGVENGELLLSPQAYREARQAAILPQLRDRAEDCFARLEGLGFQETERDDLICLQNREYPKLFYGLWVLCRAKDTSWKRMNYLRLDYRSALRGKPLPEDMIRSLPPRKAEMVRTLDGAMRARGMTGKIKPLREITSGMRFQLEYAGGGKNAMGVYADAESLTLCLYFNDFQNISAMSRYFREHDPEMGVWLDGKFPERLCACPSNRRVELGCGERRICGLSCRADIENPGPEDLGAALGILEILKQLKEQ